MLMNDKLHRQTRQKDMILRVIAEEYGEKPVVLDELRWRVFIREKSEEGERALTISRSYRNSFARTIREYLPSLRLHKLDHPELVAVELVARAAVCRCQASHILKQVYESPVVAVYFDLKRPKSID